MLGFSKEIELKRKILIFLDEQMGYVTVDEIAKHLGESTSQTIRKYLKEVEQELELLYLPSELSIEVSARRGIRLNREGIGFQYVLEKLYSEDLTYQIYRALLLTRQFPTADFCQKHQISFSTLRRLVKKVNQSLVSYNIFIRIGKKTSIKGDEAQIRLLFFLVFYHVHQKISGIPWITAEKYLEKGQKICEKFYTVPDKERLEVFALWLMINQQSENQGNRISSELLEEAYGPEQLSDENYPPATFNFLLLLTYSLEIFNFEPYLTFEKIHRNQFSEGVKKWIELFEKNIRMLSRIEKEYFFHAFYKNDVVHNIIDYQNDIKQVIQKFDSRSFQNQTYFYRVFEELW